MKRPYEGINSKAHKKGPMAHMSRESVLVIVVNDEAQGLQQWLLYAIHKKEEPPRMCWFLTLPDG